MARAIRHARRVGAKLIVIDTFATWAGLDGEYRIPLETPAAQLAHAYHRPSPYGRGPAPQE